jgi:hypothetical protein
MLRNNYHISSLRDDGGRITIVSTHMPSLRDEMNDVYCRTCGKCAAALRNGYPCLGKCAVILRDGCLCLGKCAAALQDGCLCLGKCAVIYTIVYLTNKQQIIMKTFIKTTSPLTPKGGTGLMCLTTNSPFGGFRGLLGEFRGLVCASCSYAAQRRL